MLGDGEERSERIYVMETASVAPSQLFLRAKFGALLRGTKRVFANE
jgi:hypothetical protein